jgi:predicted RNA-binding Zn-ribbon protein involved in translation (DUF1610 family)
MTTETKDPLDQLPWSDEEDNDLLPGEPVHPAEEAAISAAKTEKKPRKPRAKKTEGEPVTSISGEVLPAEIEAEERGLVTVQPRADHHIVTGMAALARMTEDEFQSTMLSIEQGQRRMREFQERAMTPGEDYGKVKGIDRPFLHLPGAEKLCLLYGLAARQEAERVVGKRDAEDNWISPPLAYHVKTYMHLGNFDGPVVAMGYGESNSWEVKYRYTFAKPICPNCGHELMKGGKDGKMAGKWFCPGFKGGCWWSVDQSAKNDDGTAVIPPPGKVENPDPHSLAETLIQMAAKRSLVAGTRRATGTSGLFTQDEDSPSVQSQSDDAPDDSAPPPEVETVAPTQTVERGGKVEKPSQVQINRLSQLSREKDLGPVNLGVYFYRVTGIPVAFGNVTDRAQQSAILLAAIQTATADQIGALIQTLETGKVQEATPGEPPQDS